MLQLGRLMPDGSMRELARAASVLQHQATADGTQATRHSNTKRGKNDNKFPDLVKHKLVRDLPQALQLGTDLPQVLQLGTDQFPDLVKYKQGRRQLHHLEG